ncbi:unnamed protein product [Moneuplotes crassus]|uniref:Uncharacterized protein n=1 Tax=Euplotes crassus TaxID=5936 RepID=A0AAD1Y4J4_EUPCR|nr:unnamed protein product [Moneuplotes crassus]
MQSFTNRRKKSRKKNSGGIDFFKKASESLKMNKMDFDNYKEVIEDHISNVKKPYIPDFGIEEELRLTQKSSHSFMNFDDNNPLFQSQRTAIKAANNWLLIADYINKVPKNEKVFRVIQRINSMRDEAMYLAAKDAQSKKRRNKRNRLMSGDKKPLELNPPNPTERVTKEPSQEKKETKGLSWLKDWMTTNNTKPGKSFQKPRRINVKDRSFVFNKSKSSLKSDNHSMKLNSTFIGRVHKNFSPEARKLSPGDEHDECFIRCMPMSPGGSRHNQADYMSIKNIKKNIQKLAELKSKINQKSFRQSWTRNNRSARKVSINLAKTNVVLNKNKLAKENQSVDKQDNFGETSLPYSEFKNTQDTNLLSKTRKLQESEIVSGNENEQSIMKKYLNESERVLKLIVKKLNLMLKALKLELKFPRKIQIKESIKLYRQLCMPNKKNPTIPEEHEDNVKVLIFQDLLGLIRNKCTGHKLNFKMYLATSRMSSHPEIMEMIKLVKYFIQNSFSKNYESERRKINIQTVMKEMRKDQKLEVDDASVSSPSPTREYDSCNPNFNFSMCREEAKKSMRDRSVCPSIIKKILQNKLVPKSNRQHRKEKIMEKEMSKNLGHNVSSFITRKHYKSPKHQKEVRINSSQLSQSSSDVVHFPKPLGVYKNRLLKIYN